MDSQTSNQSYESYFKQKETQWETLCLRCGSCCGAYDDPCVNLRKDKENKYYCTIYSQRLGAQKTIKGETFNCVPIKKILYKHWAKDYLCIYKKKSWMF